MSDSQIDALRADFERDLAGATTLSRRSARVRDRYLARKGGLVSALLKALGSAPARRASAPGQARQRSQTAHRSRARRAASTAAEREPPASGRGRRHAARPPARARPSPSADAAARAHRGDLQPLWVPGHRRPRARRRLPQLRSAQHAAGASRARHAGHAVPRRPRCDPRPAHRRRCCARTPPACRSATWSSIQPPVRLIAPGRVYRRDDLDLTHTPMFTQVEGLVVGEGVTLADLKGTLFAFVHELFGARTRACASVRASSRTPSRAREVDISCAACGGARLLRCASAPAGSRSSAAAWCIPAVFEAVGYDPERYTGFAFGMGIERVGAAQVGRRGHPPVLRKRPALPGAVPAVRLVYTWLCELVTCAGRRRVRSRARSACAGSRSRRSNTAAQPVIDFEITANRPDCLSHLGLAREASAIWGLPLQLPDMRRAPWRTPTPQMPESLDVTHRRRRRCARATARRSSTSAIGPSPRLAARAARGRRRASDQQHRRRHQLRDARDRPADARVRPRTAARAGARRSAARRPGETHSRRSTASSARWTPTCWSSPTPSAPSAIGGVMGGRDSEIGADDDGDRARERVLRADVGSAHEQAAGAEDRSVDRVSSAAATSRRRRWASPARPRCFAADRRRRSRSARAHRSLSRAAASPARVELRASRIARVLGQARADRRTFRGSSSRSASTWTSTDVERRTAGRSPCRRFRVDVPREDGSHRGSRPALRLRSAAGDVSRRCSAPQAPPDPADRARSAASGRR